MTLLFVAGLGGALLPGCNLFKKSADKAKNGVENAVSSQVKGTVTDNHGKPVAGTTVRLYSLLDNTHFVEGGDIRKGEAYIDREAVLKSKNDVGSARTDAKGRFIFDHVLPSAFLAVATKQGCCAGFAGFDEETGVLSLDTLIKPNFKNGLNFSIPTFVIACATPPQVGPDGNSDDAPPFEPEPPPPPTCDMASCSMAGGSCDGDACNITCATASCEQSGGSCVDGACVAAPACDASACMDAGGMCDGDACVTPTCDDAACAAVRGTCSGDGMRCDIPACFAAEADCMAGGGSCSADGSTCELPACNSDAECQAAQPGAWCDHPGDVAAAKCEPPLPGEIVPPVEALGWTELRITDSSDRLLADASAGNQQIAAGDIPGDGVIRIHAKYGGSASSAFVQVQSGGQNCPNLPPRSDFMAVTLQDGLLVSSQGDFVELVLHGGYEKIQLSTSDVLGEGERSFTVDVGDACAAPQHAFVAILSWDAGPGQPADLDLNVWNGAGDLVFVGKKDAAWGRIAHECKGPGPEVFEADDPAQGPFTIKVQFFSGKPREIEGKLRILRMLDGQARDESFTFLVHRPKDVAELGVFAAQ